MAQAPLGIDERRHIPRSPATEFSFQEFGGQTTFIEKVRTVGITVLEIFSNNPNRIFWFITNRSANDGDVGFSPELASGNGILLVASGGFVSQKVQDDGDAVIQAFYGVAAAAGSTWYTYEIVRTGGG